LQLLDNVARTRSVAGGGESHQRHVRENFTQREICRYSAEVVPFADQCASVNVELFRP